MTGRELQIKLFIGNLSKQVTDAQLNELASPYGALLSAVVITERGNGESRGFGFIEFTNKADAQAAITGLHGREVWGLPINVNEAQPKKEAVRH